MQIGRASGMQLLEQSVQELLDREVISPAIAAPYLLSATRNDQDAENDRKRDAERTRTEDSR